MGLFGGDSSDYGGGRRLARIEKKLDLILANLGLESEEDVPGEVLELLRRGRKIHAIRAWREATGDSLKDAKEAVEEIERGRLPGT